LAKRPIKQLLSNDQNELDAPTWRRHHVLAVRGTPQPLRTSREVSGLPTARKRRRDRREKAPAAWYRHKHAGSGRRVCYRGHATTSAGARLGCSGPCSAISPGIAVAPPAQPRTGTTDHIQTIFRPPQRIKKAGLAGLWDATNSDLRGDLDGCGCFDHPSGKRCKTRQHQRGFFVRYARGKYGVDRFQHSPILGEYLER
jgi:hypothetical protein